MAASRVRRYLMRRLPRGGGAPPPPPPPPPASAVQFAPSGSPTFSLASTSGASSAPYTVGVAVHRGLIPTGQAVGVTGVTGAQVDVRNRWPDGSVKFCVVSGTATVAAGVTAKATLRAGTAATGAALTEADLMASNVEATLQFADGPVVALRSLIGVAAAPSAAGTITGGMARTLASGPRMSSWLYCAPASATNAHLVAWFEVRYYGGTLVHVLPWLENGWTRVGSCAGQVGALTFTLGGTQRFTATDVHIANHCRVVAQDTAGVGHWAGAAPDLYVAPDPEYLQITGLVPTYFADTSASAAQLNALTPAYSPAVFGQLVSSPRNSEGDGTANGGYDTGMASAGYHAGIGLLPEWDAFYLSSRADQRAWRAVVANALGYGRYGVHFRDELTLKPVSPADAANKTLTQTSLALYGSAGSRNRHSIADVGNNQFGLSETLPAPDGYAMPDSRVLLPEYWAKTHHPSAGFLAYLLTGHEWFLEAAQFTAGTCFLSMNNVHRDYGKGLQLTHLQTIRSAAWGLRSTFQAATISRDGDAMQTGFVGVAQENIAYYHANYIASPCGSFGVPRPYSNFQPGATPPRYSINAWEVDFWLASWGYGAKLAPPVTTQRQTQMDAFALWSAQWIVGRLGALSDANSYGYNAAGRQNSVAIANSSSDAPWVGNQGPWLSNWGEAWTLTHGTSNAANTNAALGSADSNNGFFPDPTSYWGNLLPAIAYAVDLGATGALESYDRLTRAPNWGEFLALAPNSPVGCVQPASMPKWASALYSTSNTWVML